MNNNFIEKLKELLNDKSLLSAEKLQDFMGETLQHLVDLQVQMHSQNPKEREEAIRSALELKDALESQMGNISKMIGVDLSQFSETDLMSRMDESEREILNNAKEQFNELKESMKPTKKNVKKNKIKISI